MILKEWDLSELMKEIFNKIRCFWRWHPEVALRYLPIAGIIKKEKREKGKILEIGSNWLGIAPYLSEPVTGLDKNFGAKKFFLLKQVQGDAECLPFADKSFDIVLAVDLFEHIAPDGRKKVLTEITRVAKDFIIVAVPCGKEAETEDKWLAEELKAKNKTYKFIEDHLRYGLPEEKEMIELIKETVNHGKIEIFSNENIPLRRFLMRGWLRKGFLANLIFRKLMLFLIPVFLRLDKKSPYRIIFKINL